MKALILSFAFLVIQVVHAADFVLPSPTVETLPNGLKVAYFVDSRMPFVDFGLIIESGYRDDPRGKSGLSLLLEKMLDRGAGGISENDWARRIERLGAVTSIRLDDETISLGAHGLSVDAETLLDWVASVARSPDLPADQIEVEKNRIVEQWGHVSDSIESLALLAFQRVLMDGTSYARGEFSSKKEFLSLQREDLIRFHSSHFVPGDSVLIVIGQFDREIMRKKILEKLGSWQGARVVRKYENYSHPLFKRSQHARSVFLVNHPGASQAAVRFGLKAPLIRSPHHYPLIVGNAILGETYNSRLNHLLREELALTYSVGSSFGFSKDFGFFGVSSSTQNSGVGKLLQKIQELLFDLRANPFREEEVKNAKEYLIGSFPLGFSTLSGVASRWAAGLFYGFGHNYLNEFFPKVTGVTSEQVNLAFQKNLEMKKGVFVVVGDAKIIESELKKAQFKIERKVSSSQFFTESHAVSKK